MVHSFALFLPVACVVEVAGRGTSTVRAALIATSVAPAARVRVRAYLRAVTNVGMGAGGAVAALALQADTRAAYTLMASRSFPVEAQPGGVQCAAGDAMVGTAETSE